MFFRKIALALTTMAAFAGIARGDTRTLTHEAVINAPVSAVWRAFTDEKEVMTWMTPLADIDLRVGGLMRTNYNPNGEIGDATTIANQILSFEPERMLSIKNVQAPEGFPWKENFQGTWSVMYFTPLGPDRTQLRIVGMGYGDGPEWEQLYGFFEVGNQMVIDELKKKFGDPGAAAGDDVMTRLGRLVGGEWIHESVNDKGEVFRVRNVYERGADSVSVAVKGWLGNEAALQAHSSALLYRDPLTGGARVLNVNERGGVAEGAITIVDDALVWDWNATELDGAKSRYHIETRFDPNSSDRYRFQLAKYEKDGSLTPLIDIWFDRVDAAPAHWSASPSRSH